MKPIPGYVNQELHWSQPSGLERAHDLTAGDDLLATLRFRSGTLAEVETADGRWTLKRQGFLHTQVTVRAAGSEADLAVFRPHWAGGGEITAGLGAGLEFASANFWNSRWAWKDHDRVLISYQGPGGLVKANATMEITPEGGRLPNLSLLAVLGWYLILLFGRDMAISAATRGATVVTVMR